MEYQPLEKLFYKDRSSERFTENSRLAQQRLLDDSSFRTSFVTNAGELFLAVPRELSILNNQVLTRESEVAEAVIGLPPSPCGPSSGALSSTRL